MVQPVTIAVRLGGMASAAAICGRGNGNGAATGAGMGATVWGAEIEPVISALDCSSRSEILAIWLCAALLVASRLAFSVVTSLPSWAIDCCIALFSSIVATSGLAGAG